MTESKKTKEVEAILSLMYDLAKSLESLLGSEQWFEVTIKSQGLSLSYGRGTSKTNP